MGHGRIGAREDGSWRKPMIDQPTLDTLLQRVDALGRELEQLRRDLLRGAAEVTGAPERKPTLFGSVPAGDVTAEMIEEAQRNLLRPLDDL
jgi:hypothetical protein